MLCLYGLIFRQPSPFPRIQGSDIQTMTNERPPLKHLDVLLATWFGAGYLPKAPGTWGSLAALPFAYVILWLGGPAALAVATVVVSVIGIWAAEGYMRQSGAHDPGAVVIDEVAGQWLTLLAAGLNPVLFIVGFILFRLFDVLKPWPISWADREIQGGLGVMADDILAGVFAGSTVYVLARLMA